MKPIWQKKKIVAKKKEKYMLLTVKLNEIYF